MMRMRVSGRDWRVYAVDADGQVVRVVADAVDATVRDLDVDGPLVVSGEAVVEVMMPDHEVPDPQPIAATVEPPTLHELLRSVVVSSVSEADEVAEEWEHGDGDVTDWPSVYELAAEVVEKAGEAPVGGKAEESVKGTSDSGSLTDDRPE